jgi:hypothetical protein
LKTPSSVQPCSSSPTSVRVGSLERVVLPVPERPKKSAGCPLGARSGPTLQEQCIVATPRRGKRNWRAEKIDFLISPA